MMRLVQVHVHVAMRRKPGGPSFVGDLCAVKIERLEVGQRAEDIEGAIRDGDLDQVDETQAGVAAQQGDPGVIDGRTAHAQHLELRHLLHSRKRHIVQLRIWQVKPLKMGQLRKFLKALASDRAVAQANPSQVRAVGQGGNTLVRNTSLVEDEHVEVVERLELGELVVADRRLMDFDRVASTRPNQLNLRLEGSFAIFQWTVLEHSLVVLVR